MDVVERLRKQDICYATVLETAGTDKMKLELAFGAILGLPA